MHWFRWTSDIGYMRKKFYKIVVRSKSVFIYHRYRSDWNYWLWCRFLDLVRFSSCRSSFTNLSWFILNFITKMHAISRRKRHRNHDCHLVKAEGQPVNERLTSPWQERSILVDRVDYFDTRIVTVFVYILCTVQRHSRLWELIAQRVQK